MTGGDRKRYAASVDGTATRTGRPTCPIVAWVGALCAARGFALAASFALFLAVALLAVAGPAAADVQVIDGTTAPIVRINIREGDVVVRTWDREAISIDGDPSLDVERRTSEESGETVPIAIPQISAFEDTPQRVSLPPESFVTAPIPSGRREVVVVKSAPGTPRSPVTVFVPNDSAFVYARAGNGTLDVEDYRGGTLVALTRNGRLTLGNVGGTVFAQTWRGPVVVRNSNIDRVRVRSLLGNVTFERCNVRQIETTTVAGSIVYDGGSFSPGLARFESTDGNVAIGANGNVQYGAHATSDGHVYTNFSEHVTVDTRNGGTSATVGDGGPVVTATTQGGNVYLYDGSLRGRAQLPPEWQPALATLQRPGLAAGARAPLSTRQHRRFVPPPAFRRFDHPQ
jgi:hypothetical protein